MKFENLEKIPDISPSADVKVSLMGNIVEMKYLSNKNTKATIIPISKDEYVLVSTGEVLQFEHHDSRKDNKKGLFKTFARLRALLNTNVVDVNKARWITLTYAENMTDTRRLYRDFQKFNQRFQYYCEKSNYGKAEYIVAVEPQDRGAWHIHMVYIWQERAPFIPNKKLFELWQENGWVVIRKLDNIDNVGAYLTSYMTDIPFEEWKGGDVRGVVPKLVKTANNEQKMVLKGQRLALYPTNMNIYRCSRGIKSPDVISMSYAEFVEMLDVFGLTCNYERAVKLTDETNDYTTNIITKQYKQKVSQGNQRKNFPGGNNI